MPVYWYFQNTSRQLTLLYLDFSIQLKIYSILWKMGSCQSYLCCKNKNSCLQPSFCTFMGGYYNQLFKFCFFSLRIMIDEISIYMVVKSWPFLGCVLPPHGELSGSLTNKKRLSWLQAVSHSLLWLESEVAIDKSSKSCKWVQLLPLGSSRCWCSCDPSLGKQQQGKRMFSET